MIDFVTVIKRCKRIVEETFKPVLAKSAALASITKSVFEGVNKTWLVMNAKTT